MNTLDTLRLTNFQSLKSSELKLAPTFTVIVGPSNLGKSAAIRALRALVSNAAATGLVRTGAATFTTEASFDDGTSISLTKGKSKSEFKIGDAVYAKAGAHQVPDDVAAVWQITSPQLNFAGQHDSPFLLAEPASVVAKTLGDLTNASMLAEAVARANKLRTAALADAKARRREADEAAAELEAHAGLDARAQRIEAARSALSDATEALTVWHELKQLNDAYVQLCDVFTQVEQQLKVNTDVGNLLAEAEQSCEQVSALESLRDAYERIQAETADRQGQIDDLSETVRSLQDQLTEVIGDTCPLCNQPISEDDKC